MRFTERIITYLKVNHRNFCYNMNMLIFVIIICHVSRGIYCSPKTLIVLTEYFLRTLFSSAICNLSTKKTNKAANIICKYSQKQVSQSFPRCHYPKYLMNQFKSCNSFVIGNLFIRHISSFASVFHIGVQCSVKLSCP